MHYTYPGPNPPVVLTTARVAYGNPSNRVTDDAGLTYNDVTKHLTAHGGVSLVGGAAPYLEMGNAVAAALSPASRGRIRYNDTAKSFQGSVDGGAYFDFLSAASAVPVARTITAGNGLTGGGDLSANRTIDVGAGNGITVNANDVAVNQGYAFSWTSAHAFQKATELYDDAAAGVSPAGRARFRYNDATKTFQGSVDGGAYADFVTGAYVPSSRTISAGNGLSGGGDLSANRTIDAVAGSGITVTADDISVNQGYAFTWTSNHTFDKTIALSDDSASAVSAAAHAKLRYNDTAKTFQGSVDGGAYFDFANAASVVPTGRTITAGAGLTGGGDLSANRTIDVVAADTTITVGANDIAVNRAHAFTWTNDHIFQKSLTVSGYVVAAATPVTAISYVGGAHTAITATTEVHDVYLNLTRAVEWATGTVANQRFVRIGQPTMRAVAASTATKAYSVWIEGPPIDGTNVTFGTDTPGSKQSYALGVGGRLYLDNSGGNAVYGGGTGSGYFRVDSSGFYMEAQTTTAPVVLFSNLAAGGAGAGTIIDCRTIRSANDLLQINNNSASRPILNLTYYGGLRLHGYNQDITGGAPYLFKVASQSAYLSLPASTELNEVLFDFGSDSRGWLAGNFATQRFFRITAPVMNSAATSTVDNAYTFYVDGAVSNVSAGGALVLTNNWAAGFGGAVQIVNTATAGASLAVTYSPGATSSANVVAITDSDTDHTSGAALYLDKSPGSSTPGYLMDIVSGANHTDHVINMATAGNNTAINLVATGGTGARLIDITRNTVAAIDDIMRITRAPASSAVGNLLALYTGGNHTGNGLYVSLGGAGLGGQIVVGHATGLGFQVYETVTHSGSTALISLSRTTASSTSNMMSISNSPSASSSGTGLHIHQRTNTTGYGLLTTIEGTGYAYGARIGDNTPVGPYTSGAFKVLEHSTSLATCTTGLFNVTLTQPGSTADMIWLVKNPGSGSTAGHGIVADFGANTGTTTGNLIDLTTRANHSGYGLKLSSYGSSYGLFVEARNANAVGAYFLDSANSIHSSVFSFARIFGSTSTANLVSIANGAGNSSTGLRLSAHSSNTGNVLWSSSINGGVAAKFEIGDTVDGDYTSQALVIRCTSATAGSARATTPNGMVRIYSESTGSYADLVYLQRSSPDGTTAGHALRIGMASAGIQSGDGINITSTVNHTGHSLYIAQASNTVPAIKVASTVVTATMAKFSNSSILSETNIGVSLENPTAATAGVQKYSPALELIGTGWKTDVTASSQVVGFALQTVPVQGTAAPSGVLTYFAKIGAGAYSSIATLTSAGTFATTVLQTTSGVILGDGVAWAVSAAGTGRIRYNDTSKTFQGSADGAAYADLGGGGGTPTSRILTAGNGLTGGGDLTADRTFDVGAGNGITVNANDVAVNQGYAFTWTNDHIFQASLSLTGYTGTSGLATITYAPGGASSAHVVDITDSNINHTSGSALRITKAPASGTIGGSGLVVAYGGGAGVTSGNALDITSSVNHTGHSLYIAQASNTVPAIKVASTVVTATMATFSNSSIANEANIGVSLANPTAASAGAQKYSPMLELIGTGWKTNATAASQTVGFAFQTRPVEGSAAPTGNLWLASSINGAAYSFWYQWESGGRFIASVVRATTFEVGSQNMNLTKTGSLITYALTNGTYGMHFGSSVSNATSGAHQSYKFSHGLHTGQTASTEISGFEIAGITRKWAAGAITTQREVLINAPTLDFDAPTSTITTAATLAITGAPIAGANALITTAYVIWAAPDVDSNFVFGKMRVHAAVSDYLYIAHFDRASSADYAVRQAPSGEVSVNSVAGQNLLLGTANNGQWRITQHGYLNQTAVTTTGHTASTEYSTFNTGTIDRTWATGALTTQREVLVKAPTYKFVAGSTITLAATLAVAGPPVASTNATITDAHALHIAAGAAGTTTNAYGLTVNAPTGATNNYAAQFLGGNVGFGVAASTAKIHVAAGSATASTAPFKFTSGALLTAAEAGTFEYLTDTIYMSPVAGRQAVSGTLFTVTSPVTVTATSTETSLVGAGKGSAVLPANFAGVAGKAFRVKAGGVYYGNDADTLTLKLYLNATAIGNSGAYTFPGSPSDKGWSFEAVVIFSAVGVSGGLECTGGLLLTTSSNGVTSLYMGNSGSGTTWDTTASATISLKSQFSSANAGNRIECRTLTIEALN